MKRFVASIIMALVVFLCLCLSASADIYSAGGDYATNSSAGVFYGQSSTNLYGATNTAIALTITSDPIPVRQGWGITLMPVFVGTNANQTASVTNFFDVGIIAGGVTNWSTTKPFSKVSTLNGTTTVKDVYFLSEDSLNNVSFIRWSSVGVAAQASMASSCVIYQVIYGYSKYAP